MGGVRPVQDGDMKVDPRIGPRTDRTKAAQGLVDEFLALGCESCEVDWRLVDDDFDVAKSAISSRVPWTLFYREGIEPFGVRSNRAAGKIYLTKNVGGE